MGDPRRSSFPGFSSHGMKASPRQASSPDAAGRDDFGSYAGSVSDCAHDAISLSSTSEAQAADRGSSPGDLLDEENGNVQGGKPQRQSQAFREVMQGAMDESTSGMNHSGRHICL